MSIKASLTCPCLKINVNKLSKCKKDKRINSYIVKNKLFYYVCHEKEQYFSP